MHPGNKGPHNRTQFQIDRVAFFSDAVIAIAITLLVLEIKIPPLGKDSSWNYIKVTFGRQLLTSFVTLIICFVTIGNLWMKHHELFEHINNYNNRLIKINLYFLLSVMLLPVTTSFMEEVNNPQNIRLFIFFLNLFFCSFTYYLMVRRIFHKKNNFSTLQSEVEIKKMKMRALLSTLILLSLSLLALFKINWFYVPLLAFPVIRIINKIRARSPAHQKT